MSTPALIEDPNDPGTFLIQSIPDAGSSPVGTGSYGSGSGNGYISPKLFWSNTGERFFEAGIDRGVLYRNGAEGVVWNGLISVTENVSGGEAKPYYIDGYKYADASSPEEYESTIEAFTYPDEFEECDGSAAMANGLRITQQFRKPFGMSYRTRVGNDINGLDHGYKLHIVYNARATPSERSYQALNDSPEASTFSWDITTRPKKFADPSFGVKYGSHIILDSRVVYPWAMEAVEKVLYGTDSSDPRLPEPQELLALFVENALLKITDNGDGTWTASGPDTIIQQIDSTTYRIDSESVIQTSPDTVQISSL